MKHEGYMQDPVDAKRPVWAGFYESGSSARWRRDRPRSRSHSAPWPWPSRR